MSLDSDTGLSGLSGLGGSSGGGGGTGPMLDFSVASNSMYVTIIQ